MKILITGASGFIGSRILKATCLEYGSENVFALTSKKIDGCQCIVYRKTEFDFSPSEKDMFASVEVIIHVGAFIPKRAQDANLITECNGNVYFTEKLTALPFENVRKIIYLSTVDVYEPAQITSEATNTLPATLYGFSKLYCEKIIKFFAAQNNVKCQILRIGHVYGPGEEKYEKFLPKAIRSIIGGGTVELWGDGSEIRSFIYIDDVVTSILKAVRLNEEIDVINVVGGTPVSIRNLIDRLILVSGREVKIIHREFNGAKRDYVFDNSKLRMYLIGAETDFMVGLQAEYDHIAGL